jgi:hypothetical protein
VPEASATVLVATQLLQTLDVLQAAHAAGSPGGESM